ncbi:SusC/RagA family TonB-linked outer membrane protein [Polaribacter sargassicola]|uniref:SusC/RagA family TonB-linked outer membrane protein n=1 Tax=Polaribacter sargassicola TaxID=2836891 RepID=UPI001F029A01|nr:SusC/RagA family TonB-linked outer membrane protein [Polaribacter sp. DS7-9]MCG1037310.1 SusC/RagA family TonB-linked outer membrane protein [Polaribacter sp. DS7-9]
MRTLLLLFCFISFSFTSNNIVSQNVNIVIEENKTVTIDEIFDIIKSQTDYTFIYRSDMFKDFPAISLKKSIIKLNDLLLSSIPKEDYNFELLDDHMIVIEEKPEVSNKNIQEIITGQVTDQFNTPLPGASVVIKGTNKGVVTDFEGKYTLKSQDASTVLIFSSLGYKPQEILIGNKKVINVQLEEDLKSLDEVVITGYQVKSKRETSSAVSVIKMKDIDVVGNTSIESMMQGQIAGVDVVNTSAAPGAAPRIRIRGTATLSGNAEPIWVVDGVMLENGVPATPQQLNDPDFLKSFNSSIGGLNPSDIESLTILKDASATAIYGTRAANGVVVVTTKKGIKGKPRISFNYTTAIKPRPRYEDFDLMNSKERAEFSLSLLEDGIGVNGGVGVAYYDGLYTRGGISKEEYIAGIREVSEMNVDWFDILFRDAVRNIADFSISGGSEKSNYYASISYTNDQGLDKVTGYKSYSLMTKISTELTDRLSLGVILNTSKRDREQNYQTQAFNHAYSSSRSLPAFNDDGSYYFYGNYDFNILHEQENTNQTSKQQEIRTTIRLDYDIAKWLTYNSLFSYTYSGNTTQQYATEASNFITRQRGYNLGQGTQTQIAESELPFGGQFNEATFNQESYLIRNSVNARFEALKDLDMDLMAGTEFRNNVYDGTNTINYGYLHDRGKIFYTPQATSDEGHILRNVAERTLYDRSFISYFATYSSMFKNKYVINANIRFDGSNIFGSNPAYRYLPLWSISGKWHIDQESFLNSAKFIDALSIRASYGLRGNIVEESSPQIISTALAPNQFTLLPEQQIQQPANPELKWETTTTINLGVDFSFFNRRLSGTFDVYKDLGDDLIAHKNVSAVTGFTTKAVNFANVTNQGIDIGLNAKIVDTKDFTYSLGVNASITSSKVTKSFIQPSISSLLSSTYKVGEVVEGKPINSMYSYRFSRLDEDGYALFLDENGNEYDALDPDFSTNVQNSTSALKYEGSRVPTSTVGITNRFNYKGFQLSFLLAAGLNYKIRLQNLAFNSEYIEDEYNMRRGVTDRWRKPGDENTATIPWLKSSTASFTQASMFNESDAQVVDGDYLRLRNVLLQYSLPKDVTEKLGINNALLKFQADNLYVWANKRLKGMDPETANYNTSFSGGSLPLPKTFTIGLSLNF